MTLLDAPSTTPALAAQSADRACSVGAIVLLFISWWLAAARPVDWPGTEPLSLRASRGEQIPHRGRADDLTSAYGIWTDDKMATAS